ncbi:MAG TPA: ABC transporter permease [Kiritimatiellia bacterium]
METSDAPRSTLHAENLLRSPAWRDLWEGIRAQPGRVGLSFFSLAIGIVALTFLLAVLGGLQLRSKKIIQELGANVLAMAPADTESSIAEKQIRVVEANLPDCFVSRIRQQDADLDMGFTVTLIETDDRLDDVRQWTMAEGRFLDRADIVDRQRHAVITKSFSEKQRLRVGSTLPVAGVSLRIVGIVDTGQGSGDPATSAVSVGENAVFVPWTVYLPVRYTFGFLQPFEASTLFIRLGPKSQLESVMARATQLLSAPDVRAAVQWTTPEQLIAGVKKLQSTIRLSAGSVTLLCMILGGTTLMSLMLANVRDRVREIGLRRALGARALDVAMLFVTEACVITGAASVAGVAIAGIVLSVSREHVEVPLILGFSTFLTPVLASIVLGCVFSYWPARMAARIEPAQALRNE